MHSNTYTPYFKCEFCGSEIPARITGPENGVFVPCSCKESREHRDRQHYIENERKKQAARKK